MKSQWAVFAVILSLLLLSLPKAEPARPAPYRSPEILADGRVTFRLPVPGFALPDPPAAGRHFPDTG